jgi:hypothetical protein
LNFRYLAVASALCIAGWNRIQSRQNQKRESLRSRIDSAPLGGLLTRAIESSRLTPSEAGKRRIWRKLGIIAAHNDTPRPDVGLLTPCKTGGFLTNYKELGGVRVDFVSFGQQGSVKGDANSTKGAVGDCVTGAVLYFQLRKRGRLIVRLLETWGWGRERCSNGEKSQTRSKL